MKILFINLLLFGTTFILAQDVRFYVEAPDSIPPGQVFGVSFHLENARGSGFDVSEWKNFAVVSGPQTSSSFSIINGVSSQEMSFTYYLQAKEVGTFTINPATVFVDGKAMRTDWEKIVVSEGVELDSEAGGAGTMFGEWRSPFGGRPKNKIQEEPALPKKKPVIGKKTYRI